MEKQGNQRLGRVVLVPFPFQGHMTPMIQLATVLHSKGFTITVAHTNFNAPDPSKHPDLDFLSLSDNLPCSDTSNFGLEHLKLVNLNCEAPLQDSLARVMEKEQAADGRVVGIIYDTLAYFAESVANHLKIPSVVFRSSSANYLLAYLAMPRLQAEGYLPLKDTMLQELVPNLYPLRFKDLPFTIPGTLEVTLSFLAITSNIRSSSAIIWNTVDNLEHSSLSELQQHYKVPVFSVGPIHKMATTSSTSLLEEDTSCISWLDKQAPNSVIYVSLGSLASMEEKELAEMAWGLANTGQPFLWVVRPGSVRGSERNELLPEGFREEVGERGLIVKWSPQKEVLAHAAVGGFWSHCGWNSTLESICEGIPLICWPHFVDQRVNARYLSYVWRVGIELDHVLDRNDIERAIRKLLVDKEGEEMRQRASEIKKKLIECICEDGSSYNSLNDLVQFFQSV